MKRLLAALLTLSMMVSIVPFDAFADSSGATIAPNASATAQEDTSTPVLDKDTVQAIISDPLLQGQCAPEQFQQTQPTVDTSDVTMEATDGFGKLLLNSINEQNDVSSDGNRIIGVSVSDNTAAVEYVTTTNADIVVSIYTDDSAEEMVASGTIYAPAMIENTGSSTVTVDISGTIPEYYTVKCYLLDTAEHAPLCKEYTDSSHTKVLVDIKNATVDDFESNRVINLDDNNSTNFAVVNPGVTLISSDDVPSNQNLLIENDTDNLNYTIDNATDDIKDLHTGSILTYEYEDGKLLIVRVKDIFVNGDTVTIHGDNSLELSDVFSIVKINSNADNEALSYDGSSAASCVEYKGLSDIDDPFDISSLDETNGAGQGSLKLGHEFKLIDKQESSLKVNGTIKLSFEVHVEYYFGNEHTFLSNSNNFELSGNLSFTGVCEGSLPLGSFGFSPVPGLYFGFEPTAKLKTSIGGTAKLKIKTTIGVEYDSITGDKNTSTEPQIEFSLAVEGSIYLGIDLSPTVKFIGEVAVLKLKAEVGATLKASKKIIKINADTFDDSSIHACSGCFELSLDSSIKLGMSLIVIFLDEYQKNFLELTFGPLEAYYSPDYNEWGYGKCPHNKYRVTLSVDTENIADYSFVVGSMADALAGIAKPLGGVRDTDGKQRCYLAPGTYTITALNSSNIPYGDTTFTIVSDPEDIEIKAGGSSSGGSGGGSSEVAPWTLDESGKLTINNEKVMIDYSDASSTPWYGSRDKITSILTQYSVKTISKYAFADCSKVTEIYIGDAITRIGDYAFSGCSSLTKVTFVGTMAQWKALSIGIGNDILDHIPIVCSDGTISESASPDYTLIDGVLTIFSQNVVNDYKSAEEVPWYNFREKITSILTQHAVKVIGDYAFADCSKVTEIYIGDEITRIGDYAFSGCSSLTKVTFVGTMAQWKALSIGIGNDVLKNIKIVCSDGLINNDETADILVESGSCGENVGWKLYTDGILRISGSGAMTNYSLASLAPWRKYTLDEDENKITHVIIDSGVTTVGDYAFFACDDLKKVEIPDSVSSIGMLAFVNCHNLIDITMPKEANSIGYGAFEDCESLKNIIIPIGIEWIQSNCFENCTSLVAITIPQSVTHLGQSAFYNCGISDGHVYYKGTIKQWNSIPSDGYNSSLRYAHIHCTDGDILPSDEFTLSSEENSIIPSTDTTISGNNYVASFTGLTPGVNYAVIVSKSSVNPLNPENLIYINQFKANDSGAYQQSFRVKSGITDADMTYVVAAGSYTFDDTPVTPGGGDSSSGGSSSGGGGGGGGAAVILGVAVAVTVGVILAMPVDVQGRVELADHAVVPGAKVSLLKNGNVVTQTIADVSGHFSLKAKRGNYELTVVYTDANGQFVQKTSRIKAPTKDFVVTF